MKGNEEGIMKGIQGEITTTKGDLRGCGYVIQYKLPKTYTYMNVIKVKLKSNGETEHHLDFFLSK